jgi:tetratricopeptide (TPR) repeat protein
VSFTGDLKKLPLADVFQSIHQNTLSGALIIRAPAGERLVSFEQGLVTGCAGADGQGIGDELVRRRVVDQKQVRASRFFRRKGNLKKNLSKKKIMESGEFNALARTLVLERIYDCFLLEEGNFEFQEDYDKSRFDDDELNTGLRIAPGEILMEAMRRIDEWSRIRRSIPSFREVYVATRDPSQEDDEAVEHMLGAASGGRTALDEIMGSMPYPRFSCLETAMQLVGDGSLRVATAPEYMTLGRQAQIDGDLEGAAHHFQRGLTYERGNEELNLRLIEVLEAQGDKQRAADERKRYAGILLEQGQRQAACEHYSKAAALVPTDPLPLERLLDLQAGEKSLDDARATADRLVEVYMQLGLGDKAKGVYPRLLMLEPRDLKLREKLAETHAGLNELATAATIYRELAQEQLDRGELTEAAERLRRVLELQPDDASATDLLHDLETGEHTDRQRRRRRYVLLTGVSIVLSAAAAWAAYEIMGLVYLHDASRQAASNLDGGPPGILDALVAHQETLDAFPDTYSAVWGEDMLEVLTKLYLREVERSAQHMDFEPSNAPDTDPSEVRKELGDVLGPLDAPTRPLEALIEEAERTLAADRHATMESLGKALQRVDQARLALSRLTPYTRNTYDWCKAHTDHLLKLQPRLHLLRARVAISHPRTRAQLDEASRRWALGGETPQEADEPDALPSSPRDPQGS